MSFLSLQNISKRYGEGAAAVAELSLDIERKEFFGLLGPSGCGKTTTLRMIAGLETPDTGRIAFDGRDITHLSPERRDFGMVFQNYALFPHLNVFENVAFGLRARKRPMSVLSWMAALSFGLRARKHSQTEVAERVRNALALVQLPGYERRAVSELSGGQQQRVAIARAIAIEPALLLFDEPLSNLDVALREETRGELRELVTKLGLTAVYVTHDQEEAFALCDRISVMNEGRVLQTGEPRELYERPALIRVARFLGRNNLIVARRLTSSDDTLGKFKTIDGEHTLTVPIERSALGPINKNSTLAIRPEHLIISKTIKSSQRYAVKRCPECARIYADNTLRFCLSDGTPLVDIASDSPETLIIPAQPDKNAEPTEVLPINTTQANSPEEALPTDENILRAIISEINFAGATTSVRLDAGGLTLEALLLNPDGLALGDDCAVQLPPNKITVLGAKE